MAKDRALPSLHNGFGDLVPVSGFELQARQDVTPLLAELARTVMDCLRNGLGKRSCVSLPPDLGKTPAASTLSVPCNLRLTYLSRVLAASRHRPN